MFKKNLFLILLLSTLIGCDNESKQKNTTDSDINKTEISKNDTKPVKEINWDSLIPEEALPDPVIVERYNNGELDDDAPEMIALREKIRELEEKAPVNKKLNGENIKIPGYLVPIEMDGDTVKEFLLVPYQGACIHTPAPPANQTIYVKTDEQSAGKFRLFDTVWVTGTINIENTSHELAETGFTVQSSKVEYYE